MNAQHTTHNAHRLNPTVADIYQRFFGALVETPTFTRIGGELLWQVMTHPTTRYFGFDHGAPVAGLDRNAGAVIVAMGEVGREDGTRTQVGDDIRTLLASADTQPLTATSKDVIARIEFNTSSQTVNAEVGKSSKGAVTLKGSQDKRGKPIKGATTLPPGEVTLSPAVDGLAPELRVDAERKKVRVAKPLPAGWRFDGERADGSHVPIEDMVDLGEGSLTVAVRELCVLMQVAPSVWQSFCENAARAREYVEIMKTQDLFKEVGEKGLGALLNQPAVQFRKVGSGVLVCREESFDTTAFFIVRGKVKVTAKTHGGAKQELAVLEAGTFFGEIAALSLRKRIADVHTMEECVLLEIDGRPLRRAFRDRSLADIQKDMRRKYVERGFRDELDEERIFAALDITKVVEAIERGLVEECIREKGKPFVEEGERPEDDEPSFHLIQKGTVMVTRKGADGRDHALAVLEEGDYFGHVAIVLGIPHTATVTALDNEVVTASLSVKAFRELFQPDSEVWAAMEQEARALLGMGEAKPLPLDSTPHEILAQADYLRKLPSAVLHDIPAEFVEFDPTDERQGVLHQQGDNSDSVYLLVSGYVQVRHRQGNNGTERLVAHVGPGMWMGELEPLLRQPVRRVTAKAVTHVRAVRVPALSFLGALDAAPHVKAEFQRAAAGRLTAWLGEVSPEQRGRELVAQQRLLAARHLRVVDLDKCIRCGNCVETCKNVHEDGISRFGWTPQPPKKLEPPIEWLPTLRMEAFGNLLFPGACRHCEDAPCLFGCPTAAITRGRSERGEVYVEADRCVGCTVCENLCPFGAIQMQPRAPRPTTKPGLFSWLKQLIAGISPSSQRGRRDGGEGDLISVKCDLCQGHAFQACVQHCPVGAVVCVESPHSLEDIVAAVGR